MKLRRFLAVSIILVIALVANGIAEDRVKKANFEEPLGNTEKAEIQFELSMAETELRAGNKDYLIQIVGIYDSHFFKPILDVERSGKTAFVLFEIDEVKKWGDHDDMENQYEILFNPDIELKLKGELGLAENSLDLTNLKIARLDLESGLAETSIKLSKSNAIRAERVELEIGLGELNTDHFGYIRFDRLKVDVGMGAAELDLRGFDGEGEAQFNVGMGSIELIISRDVGVRAYAENNFLSSIDLDEMRLVDEDTYESHDYESKSSHLILELEVGMGSIELEWE
ncbi:hypothetical protein K8I28_10810 [bacterium]|nr:hypothetical protein [bacterium]